MAIVCIDYNLTDLSECECKLNLNILVAGLTTYFTAEVNIDLCHVHSAASIAYLLNV